MRNLGVVNGVVLDGSGSSQFYDGQTHIRGDGRTVLCFLLLWYDEAPLIEKCPYSEPTTVIKYGSRGEGVKWVQWHLNKHGAKLDTDGVFGVQSLAALKAFQRANNLTVDGLCGNKTRNVLRGLVKNE
jgi:peptidoglycan hydrolase-like protein with peptidoglycan-binding domain